MPNVFTAVAIDLTDRMSPFGSVHIRDKISVAQRLAAGGIAVAYNDSAVYWQGPVVSGAIVRQDGDAKNIVVTFDNVGSSGLEIHNTSGMEICVLSRILNCSGTEGWHPIRILPRAKIRNLRSNQIAVDLPEQYFSVALCCSDMRGRLLHGSTNQEGYMQEHAVISWLLPFGSL